MVEQTYRNKEVSEIRRRVLEEHVDLSFRILSYNKCNKECSKDNDLARVEWITWYGRIVKGRRRNYLLA